MTLAAEIDHNGTSPEKLLAPVLSAQLDSQRHAADRHESRADQSFGKHMRHTLAVFRHGARTDEGDQAWMRRECDISKIGKKHRRIGYLFQQRRIAIIFYRTQSHVRSFHL